MVQQQACSFKSIDIVLSTWHQVKQRKHGNETDIGIEFLCRLFLLLPQTKPMFGIVSSSSDDSQQVQEGKIRQQAKQLIESFDCILSTIGPDLDDLDEFIIEYSTVLVKSKMSKLCVVESIQAVKDTIISCFDTTNDWNDQYDTAWDELLSMLSGKMIQYM